VIDQRWIQTSSGTALERVQYGFDQGNNRLWRDNLVADATSANQDEYYTYDGLYQLTTLQRGQLNSGKTGINGTPTWEEDFTFDPVGNWNKYETKISGAANLVQSRNYNAANALTAISATTRFSASNFAGNMTSVPVPGSWSSGYNLTYDAWNRLIKVTNLSSSSSGSSGSSSLMGARLIASSSSSSSSSSSTVATYAYDGMNRRTTKTTNLFRHYYYSQQWQILEERVGSTTTLAQQFVWGLRYPDDLVLRDQSTSRLYALHDYFNCTAVADTMGTVQERYGYNAFGQPRVMTPSFGSRASSSYTWETLFGDYRWDSETGFYQVRFRYLHPTLGRWLTRDPIGQNGGINLYGYVLNNPINYFDLFGLFTSGSGTFTDNFFTHNFQGGPASQLSFNYSCPSDAPYLSTWGLQSTVPPPPKSPHGNSFPSNFTTSSGPSGNGPNYSVSVNVTSTATFGSWYGSTFIPSINVTYTCSKCPSQNGPQRNDPPPLPTGWPIENPGFPLVPVF
jgi:RHS repeat-associated protein